MTTPSCADFTMIPAVLAGVNTLLALTPPPRPVLALTPPPRPGLALTRCPAQGSP